MNILVVAHYQNDGSPTAIFVHEQMLAYHSLGHSVRVVVPIALGKRGLDGRRLAATVCRKEIDGIPHYFVRHLSLSNFGKKRFNTTTAICVLKANLRTVLDGFAPDIIHAHTLGLDSGIGAWLKERLNIPLVVTTHGGDTFIPYNKGERSILKQLADRADHLVCVSTLLKRRMEECSVSTPISVILNGFHVPDSPAYTDKRPLSIIQAGYLVARKKADVTIRAFASLRERHPDASLDIVGSGSELPRFQALCNDLGVADAVHFHGFLPNPKTLEKMSKARFFVMPSINEGFGIVYLEAMASGCITIGTEGEGIADLIVSGENGFLVPPDDPDAIVRTIEWCLANPMRSSVIAEQGRKTSQDMSWEKNATQYAALFQSLTER